MDNDKQVIYVLTNSSMPGLIKIGRTSRIEIEKRMRELYTTGVPVPFECYFACEVENAATIENDIHFAFDDLRVNPSREFFELEPDKVVAILKHLSINDLTIEVSNEINSEVDIAERASAQRMRSSRKRPTLRFDVIGIPAGGVLKFINNEQVQVKVIDDRKVEFNGEKLSLSMATRKVLGKPSDYPIQPSPYWLFNGTRLKDIYEQVYAEED